MKFLLNHLTFNIDVFCFTIRSEFIAHHACKITNIRSLYFTNVESRTCFESGYFIFGMGCHFSVVVQPLKL